MDQSSNKLLSSIWAHFRQEERCRCCFSRNFQAWLGLIDWGQCLLRVWFLLEQENSETHTRTWVALETPPSASDTVVTRAKLCMKKNGSLGRKLEKLNSCLMTQFKWSESHYKIISEYLWRIEGLTFDLLSDFPLYNFGTSFINWNTNETSSWSSLTHHLAPAFGVKLPTFRSCCVFCPGGLFRSTTLSLFPGTCPKSHLHVKPRPFCYRAR